MKTIAKIILAIIISILLLFVVIVLFVDHKRLDIPQNKLEKMYHPEITKINFPLMISMQDIEKLADKKIKKELINKAIQLKNKNNKLLLKVSRTGSLDFVLSERHVNLSVPLKIEVQFIKKVFGKRNIQIFKKEPLTFYIAAKFRSSIELLPTLKLKTKTAFIDIQWIEEPNLKILGIEFKLKQKITELLMSKSQEITATIDGLASSKIDLKKPTLKVWKSIQKSIKVKNKIKNLYFKIQPYSLGVYLHKSQRDSLVLDLIVASKIFVRFGEDTSKIAKVEFPKHIQLISRKKLKNEVSQIHLHCLLPLARLNKITQKEFVGSTVQVKGRKVIIKSIQLVNGKHDIYVKIKHTGSVRGKFVIKGFPEFTNENKMVRIKNMSFENTFEYDVYHSMGDLLHQKILVEIEKYLRFDIGELMESFPVHIRKGINKSKVAKKADITLDKVKIEKIKIKLTKHTIQLLISGEGNLNIALKRECFK